MGQQKELCRDYIYGSIEAAGRTFRRAIRTLLKVRTYLFAITVIALASGISTAVFSLAHAVIFHPLPFPNQQSLRVIWKAGATPVVILSDTVWH
jgi:hypothetical protein